MDIRELLKNKNNKSSYNLDSNKQDNIRDNLNRRFVENIAANTYDLSQYADELESFKKYGVVINPVDSYQDLQRKRAENQSAWEQFGNFLTQAVVGEVTLGTLEGVGNIADGIINIFTGDQYNVNPYTEAMTNAKESLKEKFQIYRKNPDANFDFSDFGWWTDQAVSVATTASLLLPAAGWARALGYLGKVSKLGKLGRASSRFVSRGLAKIPGKGKTVASDFGAMRTVAARAGKIDKSIRGGTEIIGTAALSRTGENYMEAKQIYNDVYASAKENIDGMIENDKNTGGNEFDKFIANHPEFKGKTTDEIAKEIARKSANKTFKNDYWMLLMDIPQFKALGSIWGKNTARTSTATERIAAANQRKLLAGATNEQLIKNNIFTRTKEGIRYALKNPKKSFLALELGEGFEEMFQGIQSEKGMEVATKYFDPSFNTRSLSSYLKDASIWEQGFWGVLGGIGFNKIGKGLQKGSHKIEALWNKSHMTAEDYERWSRSNDKIALEQINGVVDTAKQFVSDMKQINDGINPYNFVIDEGTGQYIIKDGNLIYETIDENQKDLLREQAIKNFVDNTALDAVDNGTLDLMKEIIGSSEFDKFIADNGVRLSAVDKALSNQVVSRMDEVSGIYYAALNDVNSLTEDSNPYVTLNTARNITRNKLMLEDYDFQLSNINDRIAEANDTGTNFSTYEEKVIYNNVQSTLNRLKLQRNKLRTQYENEEISKSAFELHDKEIERNERSLINLIARTTNRGAFEEIKEYIKDLDYDTQNILTQLEKYFEDFNKDIEPNVPTETINNLIKQKAAVSIRKAFTEAQIPITKKDYEELYDEFSYAMDNMMVKKVKDGIEKVKEYLRNAEDFDTAMSKIMNENTGDKKLDDILSFLKYGYVREGIMDERVKGQLLSNTEFASVIIEARKERDKANKRNKEAKEQGIEIPSNEELAESSLSTGEETKTDSADTSSVINPKQDVVTDNLVDDNKPQEPTPTGVQTSPDEKPIIDDKIPVEENPLDIGITEKELQEQAIIAEGYETNSLKASLDASKYVMQVGFKESGRFENIAKALENGDASKYEEFIKEVTDFLVQRGYSKNLAEVTAKKAFTNTVASFAAMNSKSAFGKLAQQLAMGFNEDSANKYSITELIDGKGIDEIVEAFLNEYSRLVNNNSINNIYVINMESLFEYILSNEDIDQQTAAYIYNNIGKFISTHDGSKFVFTGFNPSASYSAKQFFDRINENKAQTLASMDDMHISLIELDQRTKDFTNALIAAANGAQAYAKIEGTSRKYGNVELDENGKPLNTHIAIYVNIKKGNKTVPIKIGILRTVKTNDNLTQYIPISHYSGFSNTININNNENVSLDCDFLFYSLINDSNKEGPAKELLTDIGNYYLVMQDIKKRLHSKIITAAQAEEEFSKAMPLDVAKRILSNSLITKLLQSEKYKFYKKENLSEIGMAIKLGTSIGSILFYGEGFNSSNILNNPTNNIAFDSKTMKARYEEWKTKVYSNYKHTYELQKGFTNENSKVNINLNVGYHTLLNTIDDKKQYPNIEDAGFDIDKNSPNHTPLVIVNSERHLIDEDGNDYGLADINIGEYSMGFLVYNEKGVKYTAYFNTAQELSGTKIQKAIYNELGYIINKQLYNTVADTHDANFDEIFDKLTELFNPKGIFIFNNFKSTFRSDSARSYGTIAIHQGKDKQGNDIYKNLITFYLRNKDNATNSNAIGLYIPRLGRQISINGIKNIKLKSGEVITEQEIKNALNEAIKEITKSVKLNKSYNVLTNRGINGSQSKYYRRENGKFIINLGGKDYVYENYGDFMLKNRGFNTNVDGSSGSFITGFLDEREVTINTRVRDTSTDVAPKNTFVSDLLFNDKNPKRKTVDTKDILEAAGVPQEKIDVLLGTNSGMPIVNKRINTSIVDDNETNAYYNQDDNNIYITAKGAAAMNNNPTNAIRLILHENLHRLFHNKRNYTDVQRERIIKELKEVYDYTRQQLENDKNRLSESIYKGITNVLNKATSSNNEQVAMEEFLMECLTQPVLIEYLNNTNYHSEVNIDGIPQSKKSIFQKIIDILLDLMGIKSNRIKNNSILAREYMILSKDKATDAGIFNKPIKTDNTQSPVEVIPASKPADKSVSKKESTSEKLKKVRKELDEVRKNFESRIKRSDNFAEDHIYYIDGKPADTSVTQRVKGKKDLEEWGVPSSCFGNTTDDAARVFFENDGRLPDDYNVPNTTEDGENSRQALEKDLNKIKYYLDNRFGKGNYGVITEEFPIGGVIKVNGEDRTIAGTMDMVVYTANGDIYIFDFKTKRLGDGKAQFDDATLKAYKAQVNIYRQLIAVNNPNLANRVKSGALIKFISNYPDPKKGKIEYRRHPKIPNQLQVREDGEEKFVNIQDSYVDYSVPYFFGDEDFEKHHIINVEQEDFIDEIKSLQESNNENKSYIDIAGSEMIQEENTVDENITDVDFDSIDLDDDSWIHEDLDSIENEDNTFNANTELIENDKKDIRYAKTDIITPIEIYAPAVSNGSTDNAYGIQVVNNMNSYINTFPSQYRGNIEQLLANNELNYTCQ